MKSHIKLLLLTIAAAAFMAVPVYAKASGSVNGTNVNVREGASRDSRIVGKLNAGDSVVILESDGEWYKINSSLASTTYINSEFVDVLSVDAKINGSNVNFRKEASVSSGVIRKLGVGDAVTVNSLSGDFYSVTQNGVSGYVHKDFVSSDLLFCVAKAAVKPEAKPEAKPAAEPSQAPAAAEPAAPAPVEPADETASIYAEVTAATGVNLRVGPSLDFEVIRTLSFGETADIVDEQGEWLKVKYNSSVGYVKSEFVTVKSGEKPKSAAFGVKVVEYAMQFLGTPYSWSGTNLKKGVDCSGFTYAVYRDMGITINRSSRDQINSGTRVDKSELMPGDLVFFDTDGGGAICHVGIYIGNGNFIHSSSSTKSYCVTINSLNESTYARQYRGACRIKQ